MQAGGFIVIWLLADYFLPHEATAGCHISITKRDQQPPKSGLLLLQALILGLFLPVRRQAVVSPDT